MNMKMKPIIAAALSLVMLLALAACGSQPAQTPETAAPTQETEPEMHRDDLPSETLRGVYNELVADYSGYSQTKRYYGENMPEVKYTETLGEDQFTITVDSTSEYVESGSWSFTDEGDALAITIAGDDFAGMMLVQDVVEAVAFYYGMVPGLAQSYVNGLGALGINNDDFSMTENAEGTTTFRIGTAGEWAMKELDQMVITGDTLYADPLDENDINVTGSVGKIRMYSIGNVDSFTMLFYEYETLDDVAYQSILNAVKTLQPKGWENFVKDYTALESVETDEYSVTIDPDEDAIFEIVDEIDGLWSYVLVQFGEPRTYGGDDGDWYYGTGTPDAVDFAELYFREVGGYQQGAAGASLAEAKAACNALSFAVAWDLWNADIETMRANMLEAWESLTDEERANFDANFPELTTLLNGCFTDWNANRGRFEDAGVADTMEDLLAVPEAEQSWNTLNSNTWTLGNGDD